MTASDAVAWLLTKPKDMPVFVLLATDPAGPKAIEEWMKEADKMGVPIKKWSGAEPTYKAFCSWPYKKLPG